MDDAEDDASDKYLPHGGMPGLLGQKINKFTKGYRSASLYYQRVFKCSTFFTILRRLYALESPPWWI
jgi:hypothetical protein